MNHEDYLKSFGGTIKLLRKYKKMTQVEMACKLNINDRTLRRYEEGRKNMTLDMFTKITEYFRLTPLELTQFITHYYHHNSKNKTYAELFWYCHTRLFILKHPRNSIVQNTSNLITHYGEDLVFNRKKKIEKISCPVWKLAMILQ